MPIRSRTFVQTYQEDICLFRTIWIRFWMALLLAAVLLMPEICDRYTLYVLNMSGICVIGAIGLNILIGYTGQISIGHAAFIAIGAYTTTIVGNWIPLPSLCLILISGLTAGIIGIFIGIPCLRLRGLYLAMATMSFCTIVEYILFHWLALTNGPMGMPAPSLSIFGFPLDSHIRFYYFIAFLVIILSLAAKNLTRMKIGRAFVSIRDRDIAASIIGVNLTYYKVLSFGLSSFYAGISGSLLAYYMTHINPEYFNLNLSVEYIGMIIVGGLGSIAGSILGALFMTIIPESLKGLFSVFCDWFGVTGFEFTDQVRFGLYGSLIIVFLIFEPSGLFGIWRNLKAFFQRWPFSY